MFEIERDKPIRTTPRPADIFANDWLRKQQLPDQYERENPEPEHVTDTQEHADGP